MFPKKERKFKIILGKRIWTNDKYWINWSFFGLYRLSIVLSIPCRGYSDLAFLGILLTASLISSKYSNPFSFCWFFFLSIFISFLNTFSSNLSSSSSWASRDSAEFLLFFSCFMYFPGLFSLSILTYISNLFSSSTFTFFFVFTPSANTDRASTIFIALYFISWFTNQSTNNFF